MNDDRDPGNAGVTALDGAIAELVRNGVVAGWLAIQDAPFRNLFLVKQVGYWSLFTWADGSIEIEEDYPPLALLPGIQAGLFRDSDGNEYEVRWVTDDRRANLWDRYGIHETPGYYMALASKQHRNRQ
ncbi:hypothetical protein [Dactylosporangium sp. NPDC000521]|uniref:hypothetical protein n=1 Tax=Dactylosporangium sp. NPDC000521 TaxID=3363975 RepID=UPI0036C9DB34